MTVREYIINEIQNDPAMKYIAVRAFWVDCNGEVNQRKGFFEDYLEAVKFESYLDNVCYSCKQPYLTTFAGSVTDGEHSHSYKVSELLNHVCKESR